MKKITLLIGFVLMSYYSYGQIPSIKQASRHELSKKDNEDLEITNENDRAELERSVRLSLQVLALFNSKDTFTVDGKSYDLGKDEDEIISLIVDNIVKNEEEANDKAAVNLKDDYFYQQLKKKYVKNKINIFKRKRDSIYSLLRTDVENKGLKAELSKVKDSIKACKDTLTRVKDDIKDMENKPLPSSFFPSCTYYQQGFYNRLYSKKSDRDFYFVNNAALQINNNANTIESELTSAFLGPFRVSFGTLISNSSSDEETVGEDDEEQIESTDETQAFQRLISGGGNIFLNVEFPLYFAEAGPWVGYMSAYGKGSADFSQISNDIDTSTANGTFGGNFYTSVSTEKNEFNFFANINYGVYFGGDEFYNALKIDSDKDKFFGFGQLIVGVTVFNNVRFSFTTNTFGSDEALRSGNVVFGIQVLSGFFEGN